MNRLTKIIAPALAASLALGAALPASAAPGRDNNGFQVRNEIKELDRKIERAEQRRLISRDEATRLDRSLNQVERLFSTYARNGLSRAELRTLDNRLDTVERQLDREIADRNSRGGRGNDWNDHRDHRDGHR